MRFASNILLFTSALTSIMPSLATEERLESAAGHQYWRNVAALEDAVGSRKKIAELKDEIDKIILEHKEFYAGDEGAGDSQDHNPKVLVPKRAHSITSPIVAKLSSERDLYLLAFQSRASYCMTSDLERNERADKSILLATYEEAVYALAKIASKSSLEYLNRLKNCFIYDGYSGLFIDGQIRYVQDQLKSGNKISPDKQRSPTYML